MHIYRLAIELALIEAKYLDHLRDPLLLIRFKKRPDSPAADV
jgi:hypothetical protein